MAHAVGLDALASSEAILSDLAVDGYAVTGGGPLAPELSSQTLAWPLHDYRTALARLPEPLQPPLAAAWGEPEADPAVRDGAFHFPALDSGHALVALHPDRRNVSSLHPVYPTLPRTPHH